MLDKKNQKYDRQLRLWQSHGQASLEKAHVCCIQATATGAETLKNLVLPGIGSFTLIDDQCITEIDLSHCFFLHPSKLGQSRAKVIAEYLCELNEEVVGLFLQEDLATLISNKPEFFIQFQLICVAGYVPPPILSLLTDYAWHHAIPVLILKVSGFVASIQPVFPCHLVTQVPQSASLTQDLQFHPPWPELSAFVEQHNWSTMDSIDIAHTPFPVILLKCFSEFYQNRRYKSSDSAVSPRDQLREFRDFIKETQKTLPQPPTEMTYANWDEAVRMANIMLPCTSKDEEKRIKLLNSLANVQSCPYDMEFKPLCEALLLFIQTYNRIPFHSKLPDMVSDTQRYLELQKIFEKKAQLDQRLLGELLTSSVPSDVFTRFCQSLNQLQFLNTPPLNASSTFQCISSENLEFVWIEWMLIAQNQFLFHHEQFTDFENDIIVFQKYMDVRKKWLLQNQKLQEWSKWDDWVNEFVRSGASELANISSIVGGVASQEAIKLITGQFVPLTGVWVFNGIKGKGCVLAYPPIPGCVS